MTAAHSTGRPAGRFRTFTTTSPTANAPQELVRHGSGKRLEQVETPPGAHLADRSGYLRVVDRPSEIVIRAALADLELDVEPERLAGELLLLVDAVVSEHLEPFQLDDHPATARAAARASTWSRTSCARRIVAPRSYAETAAPTDAAVEPVALRGRP